MRSWRASRSARDSAFALTRTALAGLPPLRLTELDASPVGGTGSLVGMDPPFTSRVATDPPHGLSQSVPTIREPNVLAVKGRGLPTARPPATIGQGRGTASTTGTSPSLPSSRARRCEACSPVGLCIVHRRNDRRDRRHRRLHRAPPSWRSSRCSEWSITAGPPRPPDSSRADERAPGRPGRHFRVHEKHLRACSGLEQDLDGHRGHRTSCCRPPR